MKILFRKTDKNYSFLAENKECSIPVCANASLEEGNIGFRPMELLLSALAGCMSIDVLLILNKQKQKVEDFRIEVEGVRKDAVPATFETIVLEIYVKGRVAEKKLQRAIDLSVEKYCSVHHMLSESIDIITKYTIDEV